MQYNDYIVASGQGAKKAFLKAMEIESSDPESHFIGVKRYFIVNTQSFETVNYALEWLDDADLSHIKFKNNTAGALIINSDTYLFFAISK
jgi:hypothetical protein